MTSMMTSQILTFLVLPKSQKSKCLENEIFFIADVALKRIVKRAELNKCDMRLVLRIL